MSKPNGRILAALTLTLALSCAPAAQDHAHPHPHPHPPAAADEIEPVSVTVFANGVQLFMEYPRLVLGLEARYLAHVTVLETGEPVKSGSLRLELTREGSTKTFEAPAPTRNGLFIPVGSLDVAGSYEATIHVQSDQIECVVPLDPVVVHADRATAKEAAEADAGDEPPNAVSFLLEQQWKIGMRMRPGMRKTLVQRLQVPGRVEAPHHADAVVSAPTSGRLIRPESGNLPGLGDRVEAGQVVAFIEPPLTAPDLVQLAANETTLETLELDLETRILALEQSLLQSRAQVEFARLALARIESLREKGLGTVAELEAARRDLRIAEHERDGAEALQASCSKAAERLAAARERTGARAGGSAFTRLPLVAPISGEIVLADHVEGESVEAHHTVFRIVDPARVWIAARVSEFDLPALPKQPGATVRLAGITERELDLVADLGGALVHTGRLVDPATRTVELHYEVPDPEGIFRLGMFVDVFLATDTELDALAVPKSAVVMDGGRPVVFVVESGETLVKRDVETGIEDRGWIELRSGVAAGEHVVTKGAYLVKMAAASPSTFGHGHVH